ncbi:NAD(P)H-dependent oxidoreductase [Haliscomenobacter sp.]|uniref:NAD(P)H-dependent oxidoreductase n=1 Tax=Haliscomenobacter sp. TaxID=2717303 RepID=UPI003BABCDC5
MNALIVYCHPSKKSYTHAVLQQIQTLLAQENWQIEVSDLYALDFQSDMSEAEYKREGFAEVDLPIPPDVKAEHQKLEWADCVLFVYPVWWSDCPAKLKGWFDRVYSVGYAYGHRPQMQPMKTIPFGAVICTAGHPNAFLEEINIAQSMQTVMLGDRLGKRFTNKEMLILGGTLDLEKVRSEHEEKLRELTLKIKTCFG